MGKNGETRAPVVSYPVKDGEETENYPDGEAARVIVDIEGASALVDF